jgi:uncharacterized membrane protein (UPF0182 family)
MSKEEFDIPEVFRRAMEEAGWQTAEEDDGGSRPPRRPLPQPPRLPRLNRPLLILLLLLLLLFSVRTIATIYTDWLWFREVGYATVWLRQWSARLVVFVVAFLVGLLFLPVNWLIARRRAMQDTTPFSPRLLRSPGIRWIILGLGLFLAFSFAGAMAAQWEIWLRYLNRVPFGVTDPIFGRDVAFYIFELPPFRFLQGWLLSLIFISLLGTIAIYAANHLSDIQRGMWRPQQSAELRQHVAVIGGILLLVWAAGYILDVYGLLFSEGGIVYGATYTDIRATLLALRIQLVLITLAALAVLYNVFRLNLRLPLLFGGLWLAATLLVGNLYPGLLQRYVVEPNEISLESEYLANNIAFTRQAFQLDEIETQPFAPIAPLAGQDLLENANTLRNIRLWDYRPLQQTYTQLQALRPYYAFNEVDIDRYEIDGEQRQVMLAGRELDKAQLPAPSWVNRSLEFTHGYGLVMNPVDVFTPEGRPAFFIRDLPPTSTVAIEVTRPEIYYGELTNDAVFVSSGREEFNYPSGDENVYASYEGTGGVLLDSALNRLAIALRLSDANVLLSNDITGQTRVQFNRAIQERIRQITPFLTLDQDPYLAVVDGRLVWIQDAYTTSDDYPYSTPVRIPRKTSEAALPGELPLFPLGPPINYIRNAAKVVVDAYDGTVTYYLSAPEDPLVQSYQRIFPDLFLPLEAMPDELRSHLRYPVDMFEVQSEQFLTYHMTDVRVFYNKEDLWEISTEVAGTGDNRAVDMPVEPYYVTMALPGEAEPEFLLIRPFSPASKPNMIGWMAARNDFPHYGQVVIYELPKQELVYGPIQIEGRIDQEPEISQQFTLWNQSGSNVIRGNLLTIPLNQSFLYVEPIYLLSSNNALPELKRVIAASESRVVMRETLAEALTAVVEGIEFGEVAALVDGGQLSPVTPGTESLPAAPPITVDQDVAALILSADAHLEAAETAQRNGDWSTYGSEIEALRQDLEELSTLVGDTSSE